MLDVETDSVEFIRKSKQMTIRNSSREEEAQSGVFKFLTFYLNEEEYGIEIHRVLEIIGMLPITPVPRTPQYNVGVINLRGKIIPVEDLRLRLGMSAIQATPETCIIVVEANGVKKGIVVDRMSEVVDIADEQIEEPTVESGINSRYLLGIGKFGDRIRILLNIDEILVSTGTVEAASASTRVGVAIDSASDGGNREAQPADEQSSVERSSAEPERKAA